LSKKSNDVTHNALNFSAIQQQVEHKFTLSITVFGFSNAMRRQLPLGEKLQTKVSLIASVRNQPLPISGP
jgi:hypothetical protein